MILKQEYNLGQNQLSYFFHKQRGVNYPHSHLCSPKMSKMFSVLCQEDFPNNRKDVIGKAFFLSFLSIDFSIKEYPKAIKHKETVVIIINIRLSGGN